MIHEGGGEGAREMEMLMKREHFLGEYLFTCTAILFI